jgi:hypothetical protein
MSALCEVCGRVRAVSRDDYTASGGGLICGRLVFPGGSIEAWCYARGYARAVAERDAARDSIKALKAQLAASHRRAPETHEFESNDGVISDRCLYWFRDARPPRQCGRPVAEHYRALSQDWVDTQTTATAERIAEAFKREDLQEALDAVSDVIRAAEVEGHKAGLKDAAKLLRETKDIISDPEHKKALWVMAGVLDSTAEDYTKDADDAD